MTESKHQPSLHFKSFFTRSSVESKLVQVHVLEEFSLRLWPEEGKMLEKSFGATKAVRRISLESLALI